MLLRTSRILAGSLTLASALLALQRFPILKLSSTGQQRLSGDSVAALSGLKTGQRAESEDFVHACNQIVESGFFSACKFSYAPITIGGVSGYDLQFGVEENDDTQIARIDIPGAIEDEIWAELAKRDPLVQKRIPGSDVATKRYIAVIEQFLRSKGMPTRIQAKHEGELGGGSLTIAFQPVDLPKVVVVVFRGNEAVPSEELRKAISAAAEGLEYTERGMRAILDANIRPLYEELGRLNLKFSKVAMAADSGQATVTVTLDEGPVYTLNSVRASEAGEENSDLIRRADFPTGKLADWRSIEASFQTIHSHLTSQGFIKAAVRHSRVLQPGNTVDLTLSISKGRQYAFGSLRLEGMDPSMEAAAREQWKLKPGAPMDAPYIRQFVKGLLQDKRFGNVKSVSQGLDATGAPPGIVNVVIRFL